MNDPVKLTWLCVCGAANPTTHLTCENCGHRARTDANVRRVPIHELPGAFAESTIETEVRAAHDLLSGAVKTLHRAGAPEGTRQVEIAGARLGRALALLDRPRNIPSGRQVCTVLGCGGLEIMPNGKCLEHGGQ